MQRLSIVMTALALALGGCLPLPEDAGEVEPTESDGGASGMDTGASGTADDTSETDDGTPAEAELDWTLELTSGGYINRMLRSPNGIVLVLQADPTAPEVEVREYSSTMELLWSQTLPNAGVGDLDALGGGEYLATGATIMSGTTVPTAWRVSCCSAVASQTYPQELDNSSIVVAELREDGIFLAIQRNLYDATFLLTPPELAPAVTLASPPLTIYNGATTPSGNVLLRIDGGDTDMLYEVQPDGTGAGIGFGGITALVGTGDELTLMTFGEEQVEIQPFGADAWVSVAIPGFNHAYDEFVFDRHDRVVLVRSEGDPGEPTTLILTELGEDGVVARTLAIPHLQHEYASSSGVVVGEDGAIYLAVTESGPGEPIASYLHRIAPLE